jgi:hypothetical protein
MTTLQINWRAISKINGDKGPRYHLLPIRRVDEICLNDLHGCELPSQQCNSRFSHSGIIAVIGKSPVSNKLQ